MLDSWVHDQETKGVRANGSRDFGIVMSGRTWYELLHVLEERAIKAEHYTEVRHCVLLQDEIYRKLREQGF